MRRTTRLKKPQVPEIEDLYRFDDLGGRPKYGGVEMTHETDIPTYETIMEEVDGKIAVEADARSDEDAALQEDIDGEVLARQGADMALQSQIDAVVASSDVKDIVGTHAALEAYDTSTLGDNDIIKVLQDETRQDQTTYYRWSVATEEFSLIGSEGPYYTKNQSDTLLNAKQNTLTAGSNVQIANDTISATDTTYTAGTGLDLTGTQFSIDNTVALKSEVPTDNAQLANGAGYLTNTDYATTTTGGVIKLNPSYATQASSAGIMRAVTKTYAAYDSGTDDMFISKGTLENVITGKGLVDQTALAAKQDVLTAGANIQINGSTISATDTTYSDFAGATSSAAGTAGLVPAPAAGDETKFLSGNGLWTTVSQYSLPIASATDLGGIKVGTNLSIDGTTGVLSATDTTYSDFTGTDGTAAGAAGLVPAPAATDADKYLKSDGTWATVSAGQTYTAGTAIDITNNVISATNTGLARVLTVDDYNYHISGDDDDGIAVWLLPAGLYQSPYLPIYDTSSHSYLNYSGLILVGGNMGAGYRTITLFNTLGDTDSFILYGSTGQKQPGDYTTGVFVGKRSSTGSPSSSTKGKVGQMWENTTTHQLYMCTSATGGTYVWEEVAFGGGGDAISAADWAALWADTIQNMNGVGV